MVLLWIQNLAFYRIYHYVHKSDYWFERTIEFKGTWLQGTQARPPSHVKLYRALRDSKIVRYGYLMISKDIWRLPSLCNDNTFVRRNTVELERGFKTVTSFLLTCVRKVWSVPIYLWIRIIKGKTEFLLLWNSFCKHQSTEQLLRLLWILLKFLRAEDDYVPSHIRLFCSSS